MLQNQIRHYRQKRGLTLAQLGNRIGTTPQSISRLETGVMTLSMDWIEKIAHALQVSPQQLLGASDFGNMPLVGIVDSLSKISVVESQNLSIGTDVSDPIALKVGGDLGPFQPGDILVFDRKSKVVCEQLKGRICLASLNNQALKLGRFMVLNEDGAHFRQLLVPLDDAVETTTIKSANWIAPLHLHFRYYNA